VTTPNSSAITITNIQVSDPTNFLVIVTNIAGNALGGVSPGVSSNAFLTVLADTNGNGLPDDWELAHGFDLNSSTNWGTFDSDGDHMSNAAEWFAGTDPFDITSFLGVGITTQGGQLQFTAVSNRTYTVQYSDGVTPVRWQKLADIFGKPVTRVETVADPNTRTNRYYRVVTPLQP
jgi:hypothetical protein